MPVMVTWDPLDNTVVWLDLPKNCLVEVVACLFIAFNARVPGKTSVWSVSAMPDVESQHYKLVWTPHLVIEKRGSFTLSSILAFSLYHSLLGFYEPSQRNKTSRRGQDESERLLQHTSTQCHNFFSLRDTDLGQDVKCNFSRHPRT